MKTAIPDTEIITLPRNSTPAWKDPAVWLPALCMGLLMALLVRACGVGIPYNDDFDSPGRALFDWSQGNFSWHSLWEQHNESRLFVPRLIWLAEAVTVGWSTKHWMYGAVAICMGQSWLLALMLRRAPVPAGLRWLASGCLALLLLHPQFAPGLFLRGSQAMVLAPSLLTVLGLFLYSWRISYTGKLLIYVVLAETSTLTFANGMIAWLLLFPIFSLLHELQDSSKKRLRILLATGLASLCGLVAIGTYLHGLRGATLPVVKGPPPHLIPYFFSWIGGSLAAIGQASTAAWIGLVLVAIATGSVVLLLVGAVREKSLARLELAWPFLALVALVVISGVVNTFGRYRMGISNAVSPRYFLITIQMTVGLIGLLPLLLATRPDGTARQSQRMSRLLVMALLLGGILYAVANWQGGIVASAGYQRALLRRQMALSIWREAPEIGPLPILSPTVPARHRTHYLAMVEAGLCQDDSRGGLWLLQALQTASSRPPVGDVKLTGAREKLNAVGWAMNPVTRTPFPAVLTVIVAPNAGLNPISIDLMSQRGPRLPTRLDTDASFFKLGFSTFPLTSRFAATPPAQLQFFAIDPLHHLVEPLQKLP